MRKRRQQRGIAMLICVFALLLLTGIGMSLLFMSDTESSINTNYRETQRAYFAATAGLQEARERLMASSPFPIAPPLALPGPGGGVVYLRNPGFNEVVEPWNAGNTYFDNQLCQERFSGLGMGEPAANVPCAAAPAGAGWYTPVNSIAPFMGTTAAVPYKWVRITLKANRSSFPYCPTGNCDSDNTVPICWDGTNQIPRPAGYAQCDSRPPGNLPYLEPVYRITSAALTGGSRRMVQMEVADDPPFVTNAAVDSLDHVTLSGNLTVNGYDYCSCDCKTDKDGNTVCLDRAGKVCDRNKWAIYSNNTVENPNKSETIVAGPNPPIAQNQPWPFDIESLVKRYKNNIDVKDVTKAPYNWSCVGSPPNCGTQTAQVFGVPPTFPPSPVDDPVGPPNMSKQVTYVPGDLKITAGTVGNGVLVVDGDLEVQGGLQFYGLILVKGVIKFTGGGADKVNVFGGILAGQQSIDDTQLGGSASIVFNVCALLNNTNPAPPKLLSARELAF
jgi:hypothetical protein